jgi:hypothetical protein
MPRPRKLCEIKQRDLCALISSGCTLPVAARHVGCSVFTIRREARRNPRFQERLRLSQLTTELTPVTTLRRAASTAWRAAAWLLQRTQPQNYARRSADAFGHHDLAELIERICDCIRDETHDSRQFARCERRINVEVRAVMRKFMLPAAAETSVPLALESESPLESNDQSAAPSTEMVCPSADNDFPPTDITPGAELEQNEAKPRPYLIRASDIPYGESRAIYLAPA